MLPPQPTDAIRPEAPQLVAVIARQPIIAEPPPLPLAEHAHLAPVREVPTRTIQLRI
jgi:hypothetical protein